MKINFVVMTTWEGDLTEWESLRFFSTYEEAEAFILLQVGSGRYYKIEKIWE